MNRINLIALGVNDVGKSMRFFKELGFITYEKADNPPIVFFDNQGTKLELFPIQELAQDINADHPPEINQGDFNGMTLAINMKAKEEVDAFMERVARNGGTIVKEPEIVSWGGYSGYFTDLDGYYWEVAYSETWKFDEQNMLIIEE